MAVFSCATLKRVGSFGRFISLQPVFSVFQEVSQIWEIVFVIEEPGSQV